MNQASPGWNDPPPVPVNVQGSGSNFKSRLLNKRVPYNFYNTSPVPAHEMPDLNHLPQVQATQSESITPCTDTNSRVAKTIDVSEPMKKLINITVKVQENTKRIEILKRLDLIEKMWINQELNTKIQQQILDFANFLDCRNIKEADDIYLNLTLNSALICSSWIIAFKYLLHHFKE